MNVVKKFGNFPINSMFLQQDNYFFGEIVTLGEEKTVREDGSTPSPSLHMKYFNKKRLQYYFCILFIL